MNKTPFQSLLELKINQLKEKIKRIDNGTRVSVEGDRETFVEEMEEVEAALNATYRRQNLKTERPFQETNSVYVDTRKLIWENGFHVNYGINHSHAFKAIEWLSITDYSLSVHDNIKKIKEIVGDKFKVDHLPNSGEIIIKLKNK